MYTFFQPKMSVEQEEADIQEMIDNEYELKEQECEYYYFYCEFFEQIYILCLLLNIIIY